MVKTNQQRINIIRYVLSSDTNLRLEGSATTHRWSCETREITGMIAIDPIFLERSRLTLAGENLLTQEFPFDPPSHTVPASVSIRVPVKKLQGDDKNRDAQMYELLKADRHPEIRFKLTKATLAGRSVLEKEWFHLNVSGKLTVGGITKTINMIVSASFQSDETLAVKGTQLLLMTDFGITPPTGMGGLLKTHDPVVIRFNLIAIKESCLEKAENGTIHQKDKFSERSHLSTAGNKTLKI